jgi:CBS-domain-containing membrane protein
VALLHADRTPPVVSTGILTVLRVLAAALAVALTLAVSTLLRASHPPAAATTLLVALGSFQTRNDALTVIVGVLILAVLGEIARQIRIKATSRPNVDPGH